MPIALKGSIRKGLYGADVVQFSIWGLYNEMKVKPGCSLIGSIDRGSCVGSPPSRGSGVRLGYSECHADSQNNKPK